MYHLYPVTTSRFMPSMLRYRFLSATTKPTLKRMFADGRKGRANMTQLSAGRWDRPRPLDPERKTKHFLARLAAVSQKADTANSRKSSSSLISLTHPGK